jgi:hypothetical protein
MALGIAIAAPTLSAGKFGQGIERRAGIRMRIAALSPGRTDVKKITLARPLPAEDEPLQEPFVVQNRVEQSLASPTDEQSGSERVRSEAQAFVLCHPGDHNDREDCGGGETLLTVHDVETTPKVPRRLGREQHRAEEVALRPVIFRVFLEVPEEILALPFLPGIGPLVTGTVNVLFSNSSESVF